MTFVGVLVDVADKQAQLFKPCFGDVTRALCGIALDNSGATDNDVRRLCFEVVLSMAGERMEPIVQIVLHPHIYVQRPLLLLEIHLVLLERRCLVEGSWQRHCQ